MRRVFCVAFLFVSFYISAQYNELGVFFGGSNPVADVGEGRFINPNKWAYGVFYKRNLHSMLSVRISLNKTELWGNDNRSSIEGRRKRDFAFSNNITEYGLGLEYNFLEYNTHKPFSYLFTPYMYGGIGYFEQDDLEYSQGVGISGQWATIVTDEKIGTWSFPFGLGLKTRFGESSFLLGFEVGGRYALSTNVDGSYSRENPHKRFGNFGSNDWYFMTGFFISYTFGQKECQCF